MIAKTLVLCLSGVLVLIYNKSLAYGLQDIHIRFSEFNQKNPTLKFFSTSPEYWKHPWTLISLRVAIIFLGIFLILISYPAVFGPITI